MFTVYFYISMRDKIIFNDKTSNAKRVINYGVSKNKSILLFGFEQLSRSEQVATAHRRDGYRFTVVSGTRLS